MKLEIEFQCYAELQSKLKDLLSYSQVTEIATRAQDFTPVITKTPFRKHKRWTQFEIEQVTSWYTNKTYNAKEMGKALGRTPQSIYQLLSKLFQKGLRQKRNKAGKVQES